MEALKEQTHYIISGIVRANKWDRSGDVTSLSIVTNSRKEYRVCPSPVATQLSNFEWDDVEVEFYLTDNLKGGPWIEVTNFKLSEQEPTPLDSQMFEGVHPDWEYIQDDWRFNIDSYIDQCEVENREIWNTHVSWTPRVLRRQSIENLKRPSFAA